MNWQLFNRISLLLLAISFSSLSNADNAWIDVRSQIEHQIDNIEGDARISHGDIVPEVSKILPDKNTEIHLYCRSGGRAEKALLALKEAGYTNVSNAGGINDARKERGLSE
jgi:phage shock protein E